MPPQVVVECVRRLDAAAVTIVGDDLVATYIHGSAALGGFVPGRSDVDVLFVVGDDVVDDRALDDLARGLAAATALCPGRGVELSVVSAGAAERPAAPWPFLLHLTTDPADATTIHGADHEGDPDLLMHYAVCRTAGVVVRGPPPVELIGAIGRQDVLTYLDGELAWALSHATEAYAVLNACRAQRYLERGELVSKIDGARLAIEDGAAADLIAAALAMHLGEQPDHLPWAPARSFVTKVRDVLRAAGA